MNEYKKKRYTMYELQHRQEGATTYEIEITRDLYEDVEMNALRYNAITPYDEHMTTTYITTLHLDEEELRNMRAIIHCANMKTSYNEMKGGFEIWKNIHFLTYGT